MNTIGSTYIRFFHLFLDFRDLLVEVTDWIFRLVLDDMQ